MSGSHNPSADSRAARIGRILDDLCTRRARGEAIADEGVFAAHAELADELRPHLAVLRELHAVRGPMDDLVARGLLQRAVDGVSGERLSLYQIEGVLGHDGMGVVLKAYDESLSRPIALKLLRPGLAEDAAAVTRAPQRKGQRKRRAGLHSARPEASQRNASAEHEELAADLPEGR